MGEVRKIEVAAVDVEALRALADWLRENSFPLTAEDSDSTQALDRILAAYEAQKWKPDPEALEVFIAKTGRPMLDTATREMQALHDAGWELRRVTDG